jgi:hypothetical protein
MMKKLTLHFSLLVLLLSTLACQMSQLGVREFERIPVSTEEALAMSETLEKAILEAEQRDSFTIEISEQQLTSYLALHYAQTDQIPISDLQIHFRDGQIWVSGLVEQNNLQLPLTIALSLGVDLSGNVVVEFNQAQLGPFPLPKAVMDTVTKEVGKAFREQLATVGEEYLIDEISIDEGSILIRGRKK